MILFIFCIQKTLYNQKTVSTNTSHKTLDMSCTWCETPLCVYTDVCKNFLCLGRCDSYDFSLNWTDDANAEIQDGDMEYDADLLVHSLDPIAGESGTLSPQKSIMYCDAYPFDGWMHSEEKGPVKTDDGLLDARLQHSLQHSPQHPLQKETGIVYATETSMTVSPVPGVPRSPSVAGEFIYTPPASPRGPSLMPPPRLLPDPTLSVRRTPLPFALRPTPKIAPPIPWVPTCAPITTHEARSSDGNVPEASCFVEQPSGLMLPWSEIGTQKSLMASLPLTSLGDFPLYPHLPPFQRSIFTHGKASSSWPLGKITVFEGEQKIVTDKHGKFIFDGDQYAKERESASRCRKLASTVRRKKTPQARRAKSGVGHSFTHTKSYKISRASTPPSLTGAQRPCSESKASTPKRPRK